MDRMTTNKNRNDYFLTIDDLCYQIGLRLDIEHDAVICLTGDEGYGKTTLGIEIGRTHDKEFNLKRNIAYLPTAADTADKFNSLKPKQSFLVDEAIKILYALKWQDRLQHLINEMYATERWQTKLSILCIPRFKDLNEQFRHHRVLIWIHVVERGIGLIFIKDRYNFVAKDPWYLEDIEKQIKIRRRYKKSLSVDDLIDLCRRFDNFNGVIRFKKLDEETQKFYNELKAKARIEAKSLEVVQENTKYMDQRNLLLKFAYEYCFVNDGIYRPIKEEELGKLLDMTQVNISTSIKKVKSEIDISTIIKKDKIDRRKKELEAHAL